MRRRCNVWRNPGGRGRRKAGSPGNGESEGPERRNRPWGRKTNLGYRNRNGQLVRRRTAIPGNDRYQRVHLLECGACGCEYGANGSDLWQRRCRICGYGRESGPRRTRWWQSWSQERRDSRTPCCTGRVHMSNGNVPNRRTCSGNRAEQRVAPVHDRSYRWRGSENFYYWVARRR